LKARQVLVGRRFGIAPTRRDCSVETLMLRRAATERGESWCFSASKVARTHGCRVGRADRLCHHVLDAERLEHRAHRAPAMMPVPAGAARKYTRPAP